MSTDIKTYVPWLRWKLGEYQALLNLSTDAKGRIIPLIEIPEIGYDFEEMKDVKSIDEHLSPFAKRVMQKWGRRKCFIDNQLIASNQIMSSGQPQIEYIFEKLRMYGIMAIPVIGYDHERSLQKEVRKIIKQDGFGLCLRINISEVAKEKFGSYLHKMFIDMNIEPEGCDFIIDLGTPENFEPIGEFANIISNIIKSLPYINNWRSLALIGTSFPGKLSKYKVGITIIPRNEWRIYKKVVTNLRELEVRIPIFGDYGINHPIVRKVDPKKIKTTANIRYTINDGWLIAKGRILKDYGYEQHQSLCKEILSSNYFLGHKYSKGDEYIRNCAIGTVPFGNSAKWREVGTNHHLEKVSRDTAKIFVS